MPWVEKTAALGAGVVVVAAEIVIGIAAGSWRSSGLGESYKLSRSLDVCHRDDQLFCRRIVGIVDEVVVDSVAGVIQRTCGTGEVAFRPGGFVVCVGIFRRRIDHIVVGDRTLQGLVAEVFVLPEYITPDGFGVVLPRAAGQDDTVEVIRISKSGKSERLEVVLTS